MKVGDKLFVPPGSYRGAVGRTYTVAKVGRVWATMEETWAPRVNIASMRTDDRQAKVYASEEALAAEIELSNSWSDLAADLRNLYSRPNHLGHEQIAAIRALIWPEVKP